MDVRKFKKNQKKNNIRQPQIKSTGFSKKRVFTSLEDST